MRSLRYDAMIGVGGIGTGVFFELTGNHTLGREESRSGHYLDRRDYCKLHIISHYVQSLLGPRFRAIPVGAVGDDLAGSTLIDEMREAGLDTRHVSVLPGERTLFSFCFVYPDGSGGNMTDGRSACHRVSPSRVTDVSEELARYAGRGIALAVPEVGLEVRSALLKEAGAHGLFRVASFTSEEMPQAIDEALPADVDLLAINGDEARAAAGILGGDRETKLEDCALLIVDRYPGLLLSITAGASGSWSWDGARLSYVPACTVDVQSTAGAGDAHLSGITAGLAAGLDLRSSQELGTLVAGLSVTSIHTINKSIDMKAVADFAPRSGVELSEGVRRAIDELVEKEA